MKLQSLFTRARVIWMCVVVAMFISCGLVVSQANADDAGKNSITVNYNYPKGEGASPVSDADFFLYKVASWDGEKPFEEHLTVDETFTQGNYKQVDVAGLLKENTNDSWTNLTSTIFHTMKLDGFNSDNADSYGVTDADGKVTFTGLDDGVYFVVSPVEAAPELIYSAQLVAVPNDDSDNPVRDVVIENAKAEAWHGPDPVHVKKVWNDGNAPDRPKSIKVALYLNLAYNDRDELEKIDEVELNADNNWSYVWDDLPEFKPGKGGYAVKEVSVPAGYDMTIVEDRVSATTAFFTITNTKDVPTTPNKPQQPQKPQTPAQTGSNVKTVAVISVAALMLAILLFIEVARSKKRNQE